MDIASHLAAVRAQIAQACAHAGRSPDEVALMAVSKVHPVEYMLEAVQAGHRLFGENRVQEWQQKAATVTGLNLAAPVEMHLIGPLQSNKTARAAELFAAVDTVDSPRIAERLNTAARALGRTLPILIEVKLSHEASKHGCLPADLPALLEALRPFESVIPSGLMTVPPWPDDLARAGEEARPCFRELRRLRDVSLTACPTLTGLSMGMSNDFAAAIEEGSTCVRVGTAIFGRRPPAPNANAE